MMKDNWSIKHKTPNFPNNQKECTPKLHVGEYLYIRLKISHVDQIWRNGYFYAFLIGMLIGTVSKEGECENINVLNVSIL